MTKPMKKKIKSIYSFPNKLSRKQIYIPKKHISSEIAQMSTKLNNKNNQNKESKKSIS
jgi:hypothetical protein